MKYLLFVYLCFFFLFSACSLNNNEKKNNHESDTCVMVLQAHTEKKPIILNRAPIDSDIDSFIMNRTSDSFKDLCFHFLKADTQFEALLYALVAVDKFNISNGYYEVACCLTNCLSYLSISDHSEKIASHFLQIGSRKDSLCAKAYYSLSVRKNYAKMWLPKENYNDSVVTLKTNSLLGSTEDYIKLKKILLYNKKTFTQLLYYSFIMADRYHYTPAKKDVREIMDRAYKQYELGELGEEAKYFCSFFY